MTALKLCQVGVARNPKIPQLAQIVGKENRQLVIAAPQRLQVGHVFHTGQLGDGTVLAVEIGQRGAIGQTRDRLKISIVVAFEFG